MDMDAICVITKIMKRCCHALLKGRSVPTEGPAQYTSDQDCASDTDKNAADIFVSLRSGTAL